MAEERQPLTQLVFGMKGMGKTYATLLFELKYYVKSSGEQQARPVIILDVQGEFSQFKAISYDINEEDRIKRTAQLRKIKRPNVYRILARHQNNIAYDKHQIMQACYDIAEFFKNGLFLMEDINKYMTSKIPDAFYSTLISVRHVGLDLILHYQKIGDPPPRITGNANIIRLHKTGDTVSKNSIAEKYTNSEAIRIAELIIDEEYYKGNLYFFIYIMALEGKILNVSEETFIRATRTYLYENNREVVLLMRRHDEYGKKLFENTNEAMTHLINQKKQLYLPPKPKKEVVIERKK